MDIEENLPDGWSLEAETTTYDDMMGRDYTTVVYRQDDTGATVRINEIVTARTNTWGYHVHHSGMHGELGDEDDLDAAKELARTFMDEPATA